MSKSKNLKILLSSFSIIAATGVVATTITSCGKGTPPSKAKTVAINNIIAPFSVDNLAPVISKEITKQLKKTVFSNLVINPLIPTSVVKYDSTKLIATTTITGTITIDTHINTFSIKVSYHFTKSLDNKNYQMSNLKITKMIPYTILPTALKVQNELDHQLYGLQALSNFKIKVNKVTASAVALGTISYTNAATKTFKTFQNMPFSVQMQPEDYPNENVWVTNDLSGLLNINQLGRDFALNDPHTNVLTQFADALYMPMWNDTKLNFYPGTTRIQNWDTKAKNQIANNKLITSTIKDNKLTVSFQGQANTKSISDNAARAAYKFGFSKTYDLTQLKNTSQAKLTNVAATLTEAAKEYIAKTNQTQKTNKTTLKDVYLVAGKVDPKTGIETWNVISKTTQKPIATISYNFAIYSAYLHWVIKTV